MPALRYFIFLLLPFIAFSCLRGELSNDELLDQPQLLFSLEQISRALEETTGSMESVKVSFILDTLGLADQEYHIESRGKKMRISGGGISGLMYGGLEMAEQIELYGKVSSCSGSPFIARRGIKFNIPLDARTPSYDDSGDAAQENIIEMWSWDFWEEFLDQMAEHRYNVLSLWNPHPFPSMIKMEDYPEVALDNVCRTTLEPVGMENEWGDPGLVTSNVVANLEVILEMSIDEKIAFWQKVMKHATDRGIDIYWINWNICPNSVAPPVEPFYKTYQINLHEYEVGKHGVTYEISNPLTIDYYRKAVKTFLLTYPEVKGLGVTAGEHMPLSWGGYNREQWLWESYGMGILDAKELQPGRTVDFIHRVWHSDMDQIMKYWGDYPDPFEVSFKYAKARLYSSPNLKFADSHVEEMEPYGLKSWWNLRNDDIFVYRWGDPEYVREFLANFPMKSTAGYYMGSDGYVWGREFISKIPELSGELEIQKHWYSFMLWGRLGYNNALEKEFFIDKIAQRLEGDQAADIYAAWLSASRIVPLVNSFHWRDWDHQWSVEVSLARPKLGGYRDVFDFMDNPSLEGSGILNPAEFVGAELNGLPVEGISPLTIADSLDFLADDAIKRVSKLSVHKDSKEEMATLEDIKAQALLGKYYASKIRAAVLLAYYEETADQSKKDKAVLHMEASLAIWLKYAEVSEANYRPQMLARTNRIDWSALSDSIVHEIRQVKNYKP